MLPTKRFLLDSERCIKSEDIERYKIILNRIIRTGDRKTVYYASYVNYLSEKAIKEILKLLKPSMVTIEVEFIFNLELFQWKISSE